jgi:parallel beta-helix repeat protein
MVIIGESSSWIATDCGFYNNSAMYENAVFFGQGYLFIAVRGSRFDGNRASVNAVGALLKDTNSTIFQNNEFLNNRAKFYGGIFMQSLSLRMDSCFFSRNSATGTGGALMLLGGGSIDAVSKNATFRMDIINSTFENNFVTAGTEADVNLEPISSGGAIYAGEVDQLNIINSTFRGNAAFFGGALYSIRSEVNIEGSTFQRNVAKYGGGGVYWSVNKGVYKSKVREESCFS